METQRRNKSSRETLFHFIFQQDGDRRNRKKLRDFSGFDFQESSEEHTAKLNYANRYLEIEDVTSICNLLGLYYKGTKDEFVYRISKLNPTVFLACIDVIPGKVIDVSHIRDPKIQSEIESLVENYKPKKSKSINVWW